MELRPVRFFSPGRLHRWNARDNNSVDWQTKPDLLRMTLQCTSFKKRFEPDKFIKTKGDLMPCLRGNFQRNGSQNMLNSSPVMLNLHENEFESISEEEKLRQEKLTIGKRNSLICKNPSPRNSMRWNDNRSPRSTGSTIDHGHCNSAASEKRPVCSRNRDLMTQTTNNFAGRTPQNAMRVSVRDEKRCAALNKCGKVSDDSKFPAEKCTAENVLLASSKKVGARTARKARVPDHKYKFFPLLHDDANFHKPSTLQKYFSNSTANKKEIKPRKSTVIRKLFPEKRIKNRSPPSRTTSTGHSAQSRSRFSSLCNKSCRCGTTAMVKMQKRPARYRPSTARHLDPTKRSTFEYFMKKLSQVSTNVQIPYEHAYPRKWELTKQTREEYADKIANVFEHNLRKFSKFKRLSRKVERKKLPKMPKWKY